MNRGGRHKRRTKALSKTTEKARQDEGWHGSKGGRRGSLWGRVRLLRGRLRTGVSEARRRLGGRVPGRGGTAGWCRELQNSNSASARRLIGVFLGRVEDKHHHTNFSIPRQNFVIIYCSISMNRLRHKHWNFVNEPFLNSKDDAWVPS